MSDFESEHDSDSSGEEAVDLNSKRPVDGVNPATLRSGYEEKSTEGHVQAESSSKSSNNSKNSSDVADMTADFLAELKEASDQPGTAKKQNEEPWQLYLQQQEVPASHTYQDPTDGTVYEWDAAKRAWFPKVWFVII